MSKVCTKCKIEKNINDFSIDKYTKDGHTYRCKECIRNYYKENKHIKKEYAEKNKDKIAKRNKLYYKKNKDRLLKGHRKWAKKNKKKLQEYNKKYRKRNRNRLNNYMKKYNNRYAIYSLFFNKLEWCEKVRKDPENEKYLQVKCTNSFCKKWFNPTRKEVYHRIDGINGVDSAGEARFYCSEECKQECSIYNQIKYPKGFIDSSQERKDHNDWADLVKERDNYECQRCGSEENLIAHHIEGLNINPIESADTDIGITLCKKCDKLAHSEINCRYIDLRKENICL